MKRIVSILLVLALCVSVGTVFASAEIEVLWVGVHDGKITSSSEAEVIEGAEQYYFADYDGWYSPASASVYGEEPIAEKTPVYTVVLPDGAYAITLNLDAEANVYAYERKAEGEYENWLAGSWLTPAEQYSLNLGEETGSDEATHSITVAGSWKSICFYVQRAEDGMSKELSLVLQFVCDSENTRFDDVKKTDWYYAAVEEAAGAGILKGVSATKFDPNGQLTRGMLVTTLWRLAGKPVLTPDPDFPAFFFPNLASDPIPDWAMDAAVWAGFNKIVQGYPDGTFRANEPVTREQMVTILYRYAITQGLEAVTLQENLAGFADADSVSAYAVSAINWAAGAGVVNGNANRLEPQRVASRADAATLLLRLQAYLEAPGNE